MSTNLEDVLWRRKESAHLEASRASENADEKQCLLSSAKSEAAYTDRDESDAIERAVRTAEQKVENAKKRLDYARNNYSKEKEADLERERDSLYADLKDVRERELENARWLEAQGDNYTYSQALERSKSTYTGSASFREKEQRVEALTAELKKIDIQLGNTELDRAIEEAKTARLKAEKEAKIARDRAAHAKSRIEQLTIEANDARKIANEKRQQAEIASKKYFDYLNGRANARMVREITFLVLSLAVFVGFVFILWGTNIVYGTFLNSGLGRRFASIIQILSFNIPLGVFALVAGLLSRGCKSNRPGIFIIMGMILVQIIASSLWFQNLYFIPWGYSMGRMIFQLLWSGLLMSIPGFISTTRLDS